MKTYEEILELLNKNGNLTQEEEYAVFEFYYKNNKDREIKALMLLKNMGLVYAVANRYLMQGVEYEDLAQEGFIGLNKAFDLFEYERGLKFSTYAMQWVRSFIGRYLGNYGRTIRMPIYLNDMYIKMQYIRNEYYEKNGVMPELSYLADELKTTEENLKRIMNLVDITNPMSLDMKINMDDHEVVFGDIIEDKNAPDVFESAISETQVEEIWSYLASILTDKELDILKRRMGVYTGGKPESLDSIGASYGVTRERVRQIESKVMRRLRHPKHMNALRPHIDMLG